MEQSFCKLVEEEFGFADVTVSEALKDIPFNQFHPVNSRILGISPS